MERKAIEYAIVGIQCDAPECDWHDDTVKYDPEYWLNKPCPKCGANLFTQEAYDQMNVLHKMFEEINNLCGPQDPKEKRINIELTHNQNGLIDGIKVAGAEKDN